MAGVSRTASPARRPGNITSPDKLEHMSVSESDLEPGTPAAVAPASGVWVCGVDLSLTSTAVSALHTGTGDLYLHRVRSSGKATDSLFSKLDRYRDLAQKVAQAACSSSPALVAIEGAQFSTSKDTSAHRRAGLWWRTVDMITSAGFVVVEVPPTTLKKWGTGKGNASKDMVLASAVRRWSQVTQNDEADAAWLADIAAYVGGANLVTHTKARDAVLAKLDLRDFEDARSAQVMAAVR